MFATKLEGDFESNRQVGKNGGDEYDQQDFVTVLLLGQRCRVFSDHRRGSLASASWPSSSRFHRRHGRRCATKAFEVEWVGTRERRGPRRLVCRGLLGSSALAGYA